MKYRQIQKIFYLVTICILFSFGLVIAINFVSAVLNNPSYIGNWMWLHCGIYVYISYILIKKINVVWDINFVKLVFTKIGLALTVYLLVFKLNIVPVWQFHSSLYQYVLLDDEEYSEDQSADDDPVFGRSSSGYSSSFKYFAPINTELDGLVTRSGTIKKDNNSTYYIVKDFNEEALVNISYSIFWQYAYIEGYNAIQEENYKTGGFIERLYKIGPYYILELIITNLGSTFLFTLIVLLITLLSPSFGISLKDFNSIGLSKVKGYDFRGAIDAFSQAIKFDSQNSDYYINRGNAKDSLKDYNGAIEDYNIAIDINPNIADSFKCRGNAKFCLDDFKGAINDFTNAIELDPNMLECIHNRGRSKASLKDFRGAIEDYKKAIELNPKGSYLHFNCGLAKKALKDDAGAIESFTKAIELNPGDPDYYYNRGLCRYSLKDYSGAIDEHTKVIELSSEFTFAYWNRGNAKDCLKDYVGAIEDYNKVIELNSNYAGIFYARGLSKYKLRDYESADMDFNTAIDIDPKQSSYYFHRGLAKHYLKDYPAAIKNFDQSIELYPNDSNAYINRGLAKYFLQDYKNAIKDYDKAIELDPNSSTAIQNRKNARDQFKNQILNTAREARGSFNKQIDDEYAKMSLEQLLSIEEHYKKYIMRDEGTENDFVVGNQEHKSVTEIQHKNTKIQTLKISPTKSTPEVIFDPKGILKIRGWSIPEEGVPFFSPIEEWITLYILDPEDITCLDINLQLVNGVSLKSLAHIIQKITYVSLKQKKFIFNWYYEEGDEEMLETGKTLSSGLDVPFHFIKLN